MFWIFMENIYNNHEPNTYTNFLCIPLHFVEENKYTGVGCGLTKREVWVVV